MFRDYTRGFIQLANQNNAIDYKYVQVNMSLITNIADQLHL